MTSGRRSYFSRAALMISHCCLSSANGAHCRGLDENTCSELHPIRHARSAAVSTPPEVEQWMPTLRVFGAGEKGFAGRSFRMSFSGPLADLDTARGIWLFH